MTVFHLSSLDSGVALLNPEKIDEKQSQISYAMKNFPMQNSYAVRSFTGFSESPGCQGQPGLSEKPVKLLTFSTSYEKRQISEIAQLIFFEFSA